MVIRFIELRWSKIGCLDRLDSMYKKCASCTNTYPFELVTNVASISYYLDVITIYLQDM